MSVIREIEALDENYYSSYPSFQELAKIYGDPYSEKLYRIRDLYYYSAHSMRKNMISKSTM